MDDLYKQAGYKQTFDASSNLVQNFRPLVEDLSALSRFIGGKFEFVRACVIEELIN